jgi:hypothetical protein
MHDRQEVQQGDIKQSTLHRPAPKTFVPLVHKLEKRPELGAKRVKEFSAMTQLHEAFSLCLGELLDWKMKVPMAP